MPERRLCADAAVNRDRIVDGAIELFGARGISVPLDEVARRAGVGVAVLPPAPQEQQLRRSIAMLAE